jgi:hypothetical protein
MAAEPSVVTPSADLLVDTPMPYKTFRNLTEVLGRGGDGAALYFSFSGVSAKSFQAVEKRRHEIGTCVRFLYLSDIETLIVKTPSKVHEMAHLSLGRSITRQVDRMGLPESDFYPLGATRFRQNRSSKEGDSTFINKTIRPGLLDWPALVIEAGYSESVLQLRRDARWWIENSNGQVRIVVLIKVNPGQKTLVIEKWMPRPAPPKVTRTYRPNFPVHVDNITIDQSVTPSSITGGPLTLEFEQIVGRPPNGQNEHDVVLTDQDLDLWASLLWIGTT